MLGVFQLIFNWNIWLKCSSSALLQEKLVLWLVTETRGKFDGMCVVKSDWVDVKIDTRWG